MKILSPQNLFDLKHELFDFNDEWAQILGSQPTNGVWIIYGKEKHGKTAFTLMLAKYLASLKKLLYVSAEEGTDSLFVDSVRRAGITPADKMGFIRYAPLPQLNTKLKKRSSPNIVIMDNATVYDDEFKRGGISRFMDDIENKLLIIVAHEERGEPSTAAARYAKKMAKVIVHVEGLTANIGGRCPGGRIIVNDEKAELFGLTFEKAA